MESHQVPGNTIVFADMTGTLIMQEADGFPDRGKDMILKFLNLGGELNVITGDSFAIAREHFFLPLVRYGRPMDGILRICSLAGYRLDEYDRDQGDLRKIHEGNPVPESVKHRLLDQIAEHFHEAGKDLSGYIPELKAQGGRVDIAPALKGDGISAPVYLEVVENKVTLFFTKNTVTDYPLFRRIVDDAAIKAFAGKHGLQLVELYCCLDIISSCKSDAVDRILSMHPAEDRAKSVIVMGDSRNDAPMFTHPFNGYSDVKGYYLGNSEEYFYEISSQSRGEISWLKGRFSGGAYEVLERAVSGLTD